MSAHREQTFTAPAAELSMDDYKEALRALKQAIKDDDVPSMAAAIAFKIFLSIFPVAIAAVAIFSMVTTPEDLATFQQAVRDFVPAQASDVVLEPVSRLVADGTRGAGGLAVGGILAGLWTASGAAATLIKSLNRTLDVQDQRGFLAQRGVALVLTFALLVTLTGLVLLIVAGRPLQNLLLPPALGRLGGAVFGGVRFLLAVGLLMALFAFVYWLGPHRERPQWTWMSPGAVVGVVGWLAVSGLFTLYVRNFGTYDATYGALGGVIVLLLWLQLSMMMLLVGAELNVELERVGSRRGLPGTSLETDGAASGAPRPPAGSGAQPGSGQPSGSPGRSPS